MSFDANVGLLAEPFIGSTNKILDESSQFLKSGIKVLL
jgi:hypothetical protein